MFKRITAESRNAVQFAFFSEIEDAKALAWYQYPLWALLALITIVVIGTAGVYIANAAADAGLANMGIVTTTIQVGLEALELLITAVAATIIVATFKVCVFAIREAR